MATFNDPNALSEVQAAVSSEINWFVDKIRTTLSAGRVRLYNCCDGSDVEASAQILGILEVGRLEVRRVVVEDDTPTRAAVEFDISAEIELHVEDDESFDCHLSEAVQVTTTFDRERSVFGCFCAELIELDFDRVHMPR